MPETLEVIWNLWPNYQATVIVICCFHVNSDEQKELLLSMFVKNYSFHWDTKETEKRGEAECLEVMLTWIILIMIFPPGMLQGVK